MAETSSKLGYKDIFQLNPAAILIIANDAPNYTILDVNDAYLYATNATRDQLLGQPVFGAFPANPTDEVSENITRTIYSFQQAIIKKVPHVMSNYRYDIPIRGTDDFEERYWTTSNTPVMDENGEVVYLIHSPSNVTELVKTTEREQAGIQALKDQRQQLFSTFMQAPVGIGIFTGKDYVVELINQSLSNLYGIKMEELIGKPIFEAMPQVKGLGFEELLNNVRNTGIPYRGESILIPVVRNNTLEDVFVDFVYEPFRELDGTISGVIVVAIDITEQVKSRKKLIEAEERASLAVAAVGLGTFDLNLTTGEIITSAQFAKIFGFDAPVSRSRYLETFHKDDLEIREKAHAEALITGTLIYEARIFWKNGSIHWGRIEGKVIYENKKAVRILGTLLDITEQKNAKEEQQKLLKQIEDSEMHLRNITSATPTALWMSDKSGDITYVNQTWIDWTGLPYEKHLGNGWLQAILEEDRERVAEQFIAAQTNRTAYEVEFRISHTDGYTHWCIANGRVQYDEQNNFVGYIGAWTDISEQKMIHQQKDDFIGIASHELKTPVTSLKAYTQILEMILKEKGEETKEVTIVSRMDKQLNRLTGLIADLLDVTKINAGKLKFNEVEFNFNQYVAEVIEEFGITIDRHKILEKLGKSVNVFADKHRIGQVIINLLSNAVKYSPNGKEIIVYTEVENNEVIFCVEDFGIGILEKNSPNMFQQFYRAAEDMQHTYPGLGLGLFISADIIKRSGGRIWFTSNAGKGSKFYFSLPVKI